uniref:T9SS type B sorting domain-containing protein n=1 Tax=uncultured Flavobacterium sp. TaxID=165435 RepID=UPI0030CA2D1E
VTATFTQIPSICQNTTAPVLPILSTNNILGTWNAVINTTTPGNTTYTFTPETSPCQNIQPYQLNITITNKNIPNFIDAISFCKGANSPVLNLTSPNGIPGTWIPTSINNSLSGIYVFTPNLDQCAVSQTINVTVFEPTLMSIDFTTNGAFAENQIVTILALDAGNYSYQLDDGILQESNVFTHVDSGIHTIKVIDKNGCSQPLSKDILIVSYPRFFTPNGDGFNDFWTIYGLNSLENPTVFIYDRYGKLIKQLKPNNIGWNGTLNGHSLPAADYWFTIDYEENNIFKTFRAHFSLIR